MKIVQLSPHLGEHICNEVFKNRPFISSEVPLQDIKLSSIFQHADEKSAVPHIHFKDIVLRIAIQRQLSSSKVVASRYNSRIFNPLQTSGIFGCGRTFFYDGILKLLVFLAQLFRDGLKTLEYVGLVLLIRILYHIVFVGANNVPLHVQHFIQSLGVNKGLHHIRHAAHNRILQKQLTHFFMKRRRNRSDSANILSQRVNDNFRDSIRPQKFFKIQRAHVYGCFVSYRD